jgi:hypothetical protein
MGPGPFAPAPTLGIALTGDESCWGGVQVETDVVAQFVARANVFQRPEDLAALVQVALGHTSHHDLFNNPENQSLIDGWQAAAFSVGYKSLSGQPDVEVCLSRPGDFPDFAIRFGGITHAFEATSCYTTGYRLGEYYRGVQTRGSPRSVRPPDLPSFDAEQLRAAIRRKAERHYSEHPHLCIYGVVRGRGGNAGKMAAELNIPEAENFASVWVIVSGTEAGEDEGPPRNYLTCVRPSPELRHIAHNWLEIPMVLGFIEGDPA